MGRSEDTVHYLIDYRRRDIARRLVGATRFLKAVQGGDTAKRAREAAVSELAERLSRLPRGTVLGIEDADRPDRQPLNLKDPRWRRAVVVIDRQQSAWWSMAEPDIDDAEKRRRERAYQRATTRRFRVCGELPILEHLALAVVRTAGVALCATDPDAMRRADMMLPAWTTDPAEAEQEFMDHFGKAIVTGTKIHAKRTEQTLASQSAANRRNQDIRDQFAEIHKKHPQWSARRRAAEIKRTLEEPLGIRQILRIAQKKV